MTTYLTFRLSSLSPSKKTEVVDVVSKSSGDVLGQIRWWGPWRCYTLQPEPNTIWNVGCLEQINEQIGAMMDDWARR